MNCGLVNPEFVTRIEEPQKLQLQQLQADARDVVTERLEEYRMWDVPDHVIRKMTYAYYHDWTRDDPSYVFLLADRLGVQPIADAPERTSSTDVHGTLHEAPRLLDTVVLPSDHPSPNFRGAQMSHDDYMHRLSTGVETWSDSL